MLRNLIIRLFYLYEIFFIKIFNRDRQYLFILSHTRSGSSLLSNIIVSHPDICGYGETMIVYKDAKHLTHLCQSTSLANRYFFPRFKYYFDKILHNHMIEDDFLFKNKKSKFIFLLRDPEQSLPSIWKTGLIFDPNWKQLEALNYYETRLDILLQYSKLIEMNKYIVLTYDDLINNTDENINRLSSFLELSSPLKAQYKVKKYVGKLMVGDWSENIKAGEILSEKNKKKDKIDFNIDLIEKGKIKYNAVLESLKN